MAPSELMATNPDEIPSKLKAGLFTVEMVGLGWIGLPSACLFAEAGARVIGADQNSSLVKVINSGKSPINEEGLPELLRKLVSSGKFTATTDTADASSKSDVIAIIVPTLVDRHKRPYYQHVEEACMEIGKGIRPGSLVLFQSTCGPGVTDRAVKSTIEKHSGLKAGEDFGIAYSPIRAMGGHVLTDIRKYPRAVGAIDEKSLDIAVAVLSCVVDGELIRTRDMATAEASKLFETIYRDVTIALSNEFAVFCEEARLDYFETMRAANSQPYSHLLAPGIGVGGHCLPVYPYLLAAETEQGKMRIPMDSRRINDQMPSHVLRLAAEGLRTCGKSVKRSRFTVLGIGYRPNVKENRFSPSVELVGLLKRRGARVCVYDPLYSADELKKMGFHTEPTLPGALEKADCTILAVGHDAFKMVKAIELAANMSRNSVVVDCTGTLEPEDIEKVGLIYRGVGRGLWSK
jgi:UDP-N-acetyl-D-mannosaminuronic acid dehydrogenase